MPDLARCKRFLGTQPSNPLPSILQRALDMTRRSASGNVVQRQHLSKPKAGVESGVEARVDRLQVGKRQFLQIASALHSQSNGLADGFVGEARGHSALDEIGGRGPRVYKARTCRLIH